MTVLKFGGKFNKGAYQTSGGLHGVGVTVVNFLSEWCEVEVCRDGHVYQQEYERGVPQGEVRRIGTTDKVGTKTTFKPDPLIFPNTKFSTTCSIAACRSWRFLNRGVKIIFRDERTGDGDDVSVRARHPRIRRAPEPRQRADPSRHHLHRRRVRRRGPGSRHAVLGEFTENVHSYVNNINTTEGGTHVSGFRAALTRTLNNYGKKENLFKDLVRHRRRLSRRADGRDLAARARSAVRRSDQNQAGQQRSRRHRHLGRGRLLWTSTSKRIPKVAKVIVQKGHAGGRGPRSARKARAIVRERKGALAGHGAAGQAARLHQPRRRQVRAVPGRGRFGRRQRRRGPLARISGDPPACEAKSSTPTSRAKTKCWPTKKSAA